MEHPISEGAAVITEERVNIVRRHFLHVKQTARQRGMQRHTIGEATTRDLQNSIVILEMAEEAGHNLPPTFQ